MKLNMHAKELLSRAISGQGQPCQHFGAVIGNPDNFLENRGGIVISAQGLSTRALAFNQCVYAYILEQDLSRCPGEILFKMGVHLRHFADTMQIKQDFIAKLAQFNEMLTLTKTQRLYLYLTALLFPTHRRDTAESASELPVHQTIIPKLTTETMQRCFTFYSSLDGVKPLLNCVKAKLLVKGLIDHEQTKSTRDKNAVLLYREALNLDPTLDFVHYSLGWLYAKNRVFDCEDKTRRMSAAVEHFVQTEGLGFEQAYYYMALLLSSGHIEPEPTLKPGHISFNQNAYCQFKTFADQAAWEHTRQVAKLGYPPAVHLLGLLYRKEVITRDIFSNDSLASIAKQLFTTAADCGYAESIKSLATLKKRDQTLLSNDTPNQASTTGVTQTVIPSAVKETHSDKAECESRPNKRRNVTAQEFEEHPKTVPNL